MPAPLPVVEEHAVLSGPSSSRRPDIQGLRAVVVIMVVAFHAGLPVPGGFIGVDVFFVISGFVITAMLHREWHQTGRIRFGRFYLRRFKRLTPAMALMVAVTMLISVLVLSPLGPQQTAAKTAVGAILFSANFVIAGTTGGYFDAPAETNPLLNAWSLSVEEQFYLVFPALIALGWILARRRGLLRFSPIVIVAGVAAVSFALTLTGSAGLTFSGTDAALGFYSPFTRAWEFAVGALLALALAKWKMHAPRLLAGSGLVGVAMLTSSLWLITDTTPFPGPWTLIPVVGALLLLLSGSSQKAFTTRALSTAPMVKIGDWSYSIYLWHWPFIVFAGLLWPGRPLVLLAAALASLLPALASYRWLEQPIRNLDGLTQSRWTRLIIATLLLPIGLATALWFTSGQGWWSSQVRQLQSATLPGHIGALNNCNTREPLGAQQSLACVWNQDAKGQPIYVLGDSNADHFSEGFIAAGKALDRPVFSASTDACPFVDIDFVDLRGKYSNEACQSYVKRTLDYLSNAALGLVVISNADVYWTSPDHAVAPTGQEASADPATKIREFRSGLERTVARLQQAGHKVVIVQTIPHWTAENGITLWDPTRCTLNAALGSGCTGERTLDQALQDDLQVRDVVAQVAVDQGATVWDPAQELCPDDLCSTRGPGFIRYRDSSHISVHQAEALAPAIQQLIEGIR